MIVIPRDRRKASTGMLGHPGCGVHPQGDDGNVVVEAYDGINTFFKGRPKEHGPGIIPEEELDHEGDVSEYFYVCGSNKPQPSPGGNPHRANEDP